MTQLRLFGSLPWPSLPSRVRATSRDLDPRGLGPCDPMHDGVGPTCANLVEAVAHCIRSCSRGASVGHTMVPILRPLAFLLAGGACQSGRASFCLSLVQALVQEFLLVQALMHAGVSLCSCRSVYKCNLDSCSLSEIVRALCLRPPTPRQRAQGVVSQVNALRSPRDVPPNAPGARGARVLARAPPWLWHRPAPPPGSAWQRPTDHGRVAGSGSRAEGGGTKHVGCAQGGPPSFCPLLPLRSPQLSSLPPLSLCKPFLSEPSSSCPGLCWGH